jgi:membrane protease YdiL (CAAX protease family)
VKRYSKKEKNMNPVTSFIKRYPQVVFWLIAWATSFFGFYMRALYPSDLWGFFVWGSFVGGALVTGIADGRGGLKTYFNRIVRWRVGIQWYAVALFLPLALRLAAFGLNIASGATVASNPQMPAWGDLIFDVVIIFFFIALGEEPGFRGFALPRLLIARSALAASLILGVLHTIWHLPLFITGEDPAITTTLIILSGSILITWLFNHARGSVLIIMILHTSVNFWGDIFRPLFTGPDVMKQEIWLTVAYVGAAVLLALVAGRELGRKPAAEAETMVVAEQPLAAK